MIAITRVPRLYLASSPDEGRCTRNTISAPFMASAATAAPAAVKSASRMPDLIPAPGSTATSAPRPIIFLTVSGVAATRDSPASVSAATATFINPPTAARPAIRPMSVCAVRSRQEVRHQDDDDDDDDHHHFGQRDESTVGLFVSRVIVARCSRIFDLGVIGHPTSPSGATRCGRT